MKILYIILASVLLAGAIQSTSYAQSVNITESFKKHFNETVQAVHETDDADEKRAILNESFNKMISVIDRIESAVSLTEDENAILATYKYDLEKKKNQLNGLDGYDQVVDKDLDDFSNFSQDMIEQASRTITIGVTTALLILIILLLL
ncbi:hypothetical protein [Natronogracilivirga saccharolytica]|uniref:Uncharacterized protein n=1 Tax=Natronogracilivirga saccharolytica TaxID=2812953 RepID=A0A8J7UVS9_9BACT|nr:hypothetical protein [Natronogracilivirga saccharolytica]MBP3193775.1 hypothetical protein [Natronogracilivirga saccharolytica]